MIYGYARVSTINQDYDAQRDALRAAGCDRIVAEKITGASLERRSLVRLIGCLLPGDRVVVVALDRLARSTRDLLEVIHQIGAAGATFRSLKEAWADTTTPAGKLMLVVIGGIAEFERARILERTSEGRTRAKLAGVRFGRPNVLTAFQRTEALDRLAQGESQTSIARSFNVSHSTISRLRD